MGNQIAPGSLIRLEEWPPTGPQRDERQNRRADNRPDDQISVHGSSRDIRYFREIQAYMETRPRSPDWLSVDITGNGVEARVVRIPERRDIDLPIREQLIVEYYSR